ncbi:MAG TPA: ChbG/HpnK family deacetylase [Acidobacteriaceae bacterium]|jgi:predicted glycoside hydrolase/deacetylase ChbG (UPF0249 family)|nr:ChbG/HpnK family deacetylase [Acidobacteriaceae bacterium]
MAVSDIGVQSHSPAAAAGPSVIINADDWGRDAAVTDRTLDCLRKGVVSSTSAMVFMEDSERAAGLAQSHAVDAGLHLNFTAPFTAARVPDRLRDQHEKVRRFLRSSRLAALVYNPGLSRSFEYAVAAQFDEYERLYGTTPARIDGHHHMHLCANVFHQKLLPEHTIVRRNFTFAPGEKGSLNRLYRRWRDGQLARRHVITDFFFSLPPLAPFSRLQKIFDLATRFSVEIETHPVQEEEYRFLVEGEVRKAAGEVAIARGYRVPAASERGR